MSESIPPSNGGRFTLKLGAEEEEAVIYGAELAGPDATHTSDARVERTTGKVSWAEEAPESLLWLQKYATAALRAAHRSRESAGWPRRLTRWRNAPGRS